MCSLPRKPRRQALAGLFGSKHYNLVVALSIGIGAESIHAACAANTFTHFTPPPFVALIIARPVHPSQERFGGIFRYPSGSARERRRAVKRDSSAPYAERQSANTDGKNKIPMPFAANAQPPKASATPIQSKTMLKRHA